MANEQIRREDEQESRKKEPLNPSARGTLKQSRRGEKSPHHSELRHVEDAGNPGGHGRGGKASRGAK